MEPKYSDKGGTRMATRNILIANLGVFFLAGCATPSRMEAVPKGAHLAAAIPGIKGARFYPDEQNDILMLAGLESIARERLDLASAGRRGPLPPANFLAISGGGDDGAFAAGLLVGWSETGQRPQFKVVTGISTGALIAPFAFLGAKYDQKLKAVYMNISAKDIYEERGLLGLFSDAMSDTTPLWRLIRRSAGQEMLDDIALGHRLIKS